MSRTVDAHDSTSDSFSALLDRLTSRGRQENAHSDSASNVAVDFDSPVASAFDSSFDSAFGSDRYSGSSSKAVSPARSRRRSVSPVMELKPTMGKTASDSALLSYEKALRIHGRHSRMPDFDSDSDSALPKVDAPRGNPAPVRPQTQTGGKRTIQKPIPKRAIPQVVPSGNSGHHAVEAQPVRKTAATIPSQATRQQPAGRDRKPPISQDALRSKTASSRRSAPKAEVIPAASPELSTQTRPAARSSASPQPTAHRKSQGKINLPLTPRKGQQKSGEKRGARGPEAHENLKLELQQHSLQLEHRRAILSIRLSDQESEQLRHRAAESGLSVSAYMRSCVLDAEHLRTQVKQALAEMRAFTGQTKQTEQARLPAPATGSGARSHGSGSGSGERWVWSRLLAKSAAALLGLWLPFRRGA
jgi:hypothetical protein